MQRLIVPFTTAALSQYALALSIRNQETAPDSMTFAEVATEHMFEKSGNLQFAEVFDSEDADDEFSDDSTCSDCEESESGSDSDSESASSGSDSESGSDSDSESTSGSEDDDDDEEGVLAQIRGFLFAQQNDQDKETCIAAAKAKRKTAVKAARQDCRANSDNRMDFRACIRPLKAAAKQTFRDEKKACCPEEVEHPNHEELDVTNLAQLGRRGGDRPRVSCDNLEEAKTNGQARCDKVGEKFPDEPEKKEKCEGHLNKWYERMSGKCSMTCEEKA